MLNADWLKSCVGGCAGGWMGGWMGLMDGWMTWCGFGCKSVCAVGVGWLIFVRAYKYVYVYMSR